MFPNPSPLDAVPLIVIAGPTASGKSELALSIAEHFGGEIVNYDSVQVYRYMDIGTAKPSRQDRLRAPHHLIDIRDPGDVYTAGDYQRDVRATLAGIRQRGNLPVLVGGTGLYLKAALEGLFEGPRRSDYWRERLESLAARKGVEHLHRLLSRIDPVTAARIAARDKPKLIRALEVRLQTGRTLSEYLAIEPRQPLTGFTVHAIGLDPPRQETYRRIDERVHRMFEAGLVEEVRQLIAKGVPPEAKALGAIGYRHILTNLNAGGAWDDIIGMIQRDTRRYAKRQMTWFRRQLRAAWFGGPGENKEIQEGVHRLIQLLLPR